MILLLAAATPAAQALTTAAPPMLWSTRLVSWVVAASIALITVGMLACIYRLVRGPHLADRALAVDTLAIQLIGLVLLLMIRWQTAWFIDGILVLSLLGFAGTVAMAQYIGRPHQRRARPRDAVMEPTGNEG